MQQIKSILIGWIETSRLCLSFKKVSLEMNHYSKVVDDALKFIIL